MKLLALFSLSLSLFSQVHYNSSPQYASGLASALPAACPAGPLTFYASTDTHELWWCLAPGPWSKLAAAASGLAVLGVTNTQAILTASNGPCTIEASESATYKPLVHDVDPALFPGSNQMKIPFVLGRRLTDTAANGSNYSRALQANTKHYIRVTCGTAVQTTTLTTKSIPAGMTFNDGPQADVGGQWKMPTRFEDRTQTIIDPKTGALLKAVSTSVEGGLPNFNGVFLLYGGFARVCGPKLVGPVGGPLGFVCTFGIYNKGSNIAYWIVPTTGEVRLLGSLPISDGGPFGPLVVDSMGNIRSFGPDNQGNTVWVNYQANFQPASSLPVSGWFPYSTVPIGQMVHDFDPAYNPAGFDCGHPWAAAGQYTLFSCGTGQDNPGWLAVLHGGDGRTIVPNCPDGDACPRIVGAADIFHIPATAGCTLHNVQQMDNVASVNVQTMQNAPRCAAFGHMVYWKFLVDPHGAALVIDGFFDGGGHWDYGPMGRISETGTGWGGVIGTPREDFLNHPYSVGIDDSPYFAGARGLSYGSTASKHPSYHQLASIAPSMELGWMADMLPFDGGQFYSPVTGATPLTGQLYKYNLQTEQPSASLARKQLPTLAASGGRSVVDISGPGSKLGDGPEDSFKYCVALAVGECRTDAIAGDVYINAPNVAFRQCVGSDGPNPQNFDLCIGNMGAYHQGMVQVDLTGKARPRVITYGLAGIRNSFYYSTAKSLPDASWALFSWGVVQPGFGNVTNVWMAKLLPLVDDHVDRSTFTRMPVSLSGVPQGTKTAVVEFGYLENGTPDQHYCTSRRESCMATGTVTDAVPFLYPSQGIQGLACANGCTVTVPVIPGRVVYYRGVFFDAGGNRLGNGLDQINTN